MLLHYLILGLVLAWAAILAGGWLGWQFLRQNGRLLLRIDELEKRLDELEFGDGDEPSGLLIGSEAPPFDLPDLVGERKSLALFQGQPVLLVFFNPACGFCKDTAAKLRKRFDAKNRKADSNGNCARPRMLIVSTGEAEANRRWFEELKVNCPVLLQKESEIAAAYRASGTPSGYLVDAGGKIASGLVMGGEALLELLEQSAGSGKQRADNSANSAEREIRFSNHSLARSKIKRDGLKTGTPAPDFRLPRLDGRGDLTLRDLRGRGVFLVFSSPGCGPCNALAPELEKFHCEHPELEVVMISKGEPKENRAKVEEHGLTFPIVLQQQWEISRRYAMFATPIAYLINEEGLIARDVAVGVDCILDLMVSATKLEAQRL
jgi:peroxiredoxin